MGCVPCIIRAGTGACPYNDNYSMYVGWHDYEFVGFDSRIILWNFIPHGLHHSPRIIQYHFPIRDMTEQTFPILSTNGDKVCSWHRVIVFPKPYLFATTLRCGFDLIIFHHQAGTPKDK
jgi:hypothetical protein